MTPSDTQTRTMMVGRPRQMSEDERRRVLVEAAAELFMNNGYHATTMDDVARAAGMSKKTVYQIFSGKSQLFDALLTDRFAPCTIAIEAEGRPSRQVLAAILERLVAFAVDERQIALTRLLIAETAQSEDIASALERQGLGRGKGALEKWVTAEVARGTLTIDDPEEAANMLFFTAAGDFLLGLLLRTRGRPSAGEVTARVERTVATFFQQFG